MITKSYSVSCHIDKKSDNDYRINCKVNSDGKTATAQYTGNSLTNGLNQIMDSVIEQIEKLTTEDASMNRIKELEAQLEAAKKKNERLSKLVYGDGSHQIDFPNMADKSNANTAKIGISYNSKNTTNNSKTDNSKNTTNNIKVDNSNAVGNLKTDDFDNLFNLMIDDYKKEYLERYQNLVKKFFN